MCNVFNIWTYLIHFFHILVCTETKKSNQVLQSNTNTSIWNQTPQSVGKGGQHPGQPLSQKKIIFNKGLELNQLHSQ